MPYYRLVEFLEGLDQSGDLSRVEVEVDADLEIAEVTRRVASSHGPAVLFGHVKDRALPVVTNLLGTEKRICHALGAATVPEAAGRIAELLDASDPEGWLERLKPETASNAVRKYRPKTVKTGRCQQVIRLGRDVDLNELPALRSWPIEDRPVITAGQVFGRDGQSRRSVVECHPACVVDRDRLAICWCPHHELAQSLSRCAERNVPLQMALAIGGDPVTFMCAMAPLVPRADVSAVAGLLRGKSAELLPCRTVDVAVPSDCEIVIEGHVDPSEQACQNVTAVSGGQRHRTVPAAPIMHVTAITHRSNPVYHALVPSWLDNEACMIRRAMLRIFLPLLRANIPDLVDCDLPTFGGARSWAFVSVRKEYSGQGRRVAHAVWGLPDLMFAKFLVILDEAVDVRQPDQVWSAIAAFADPARDVFFHQGPPDPWDSAAEPSGLHQRMAIDATTKLVEETGRAPVLKEADAEFVTRLVAQRWPEYGLPDSILDSNREDPAS
jgi:4-hydroxy-3-polyprenylbenzoate decarboxylase